MSEKQITQRIHIIDAIRGFAVLGILIANIQSWSGYKFIPIVSIESLPYYSLDRLFTALHYWLVDGKFYSIFCILFGAGFGLQFIRKQNQMHSFLSVYRRRLVFLFLFGVAHALLWSGDILTLYALLAFVLVMLRDIPLNRLLGCSIFMLCFFVLPQTLVWIWGGVEPVAAGIAKVNYPGMTSEFITTTFQSGSWGDMFMVNLEKLHSRWMNYLPNGRISRVLGLFLLGFYLAQSDYFKKAIYGRRQLIVFIVVGLGATALARFTGTNISRWSVSGFDVLLKFILVVGQVALAFAYMSLLALIYDRSWGEKLLLPLTLIGRMAFTSYLSQSVIGAFIFYGVGLGMWGRWGLAQLWLLAIAIFACQVIFCALWFKYFKQGPIEWLWGSLTAGKFRANRRL